MAAVVRPVLPYPWERLPRLSREAVRVERRARRALSPVPVLDRIATALSELIAADVRVRALPTATAPLNAERALCFETIDGSVAIAVELEAALSSLLLARVLQRTTGLTALDTPLDAVSRGALAALGVEAARRAGATLPLRARRDEPEGGHDARVDGCVDVDGRAYHVAACLYVREIPAARPLAETDLRALGDLPIRVPIVAAVSLAARDELATLAPGDVWLPGRGFLIYDTATAPSHGGAPDIARPNTLAWRALTRAALCPGDAERGVEIGCSDAGRLVLRGNVIALGADVIDARRGGDEAMSGTEETLTSMALDAPIVVRVEVGSVTLTARQWGALRPGDVLETGLRLSEPAVLRVAGREVARGELVSIDGELGVRIREIVSDDGSG
jgi:flagellar motor switch/type III secretory pathway protein FliN